MGDECSRFQGLELAFDGAGIPSPEIRALSVFSVKIPRFCGVFWRGLEALKGQPIIGPFRIAGSPLDAFSFRMKSTLSFEDLNIGETWTSPGRTVTEADIVNFACHTGDFNPLHVDVEFASTTIYRKPIAHGLLGLSWAAGLGSNFPRVNTLSFAAVRDWEFLRPVYTGDTLHAETQVLDKMPTGRRSGKVAWLIKLVNQKGEVTQQGVFETLVSTKLREPRTSDRTTNGIAADTSASSRT